MMRALSVVLVFSCFLYACGRKKDLPVVPGTLFEGQFAASDEESEDVFFDYYDDEGAEDEDEED